MKQKIDVGLNSKIKEFARKFKIVKTDNNDADVFESFANYVVASILLEEELNDVTSVSTNKAQGIDGIVISVNNCLVKELDDLNKFSTTEPIKIKIGFIQSTIQKSFDEQKLSSFTDEVVKFLSKTIDIDPFSSIYRKLLDESDSYIDLIEETPRISLFFLSARTSHEIMQEKLNVEKRKISKRTDIENNIYLENFLVYQKDEIKEEYEKISKFHSVQMKFDTNVQLTSVDDIELSLLATIKFSELKKLILTPDGNLKERLFVENVRNFIGTTTVNSDIKKTLDDEKNRLFFPYLNNGLVIVCNKIEKHPVKPNEFTLTFPRIINGCQTTNMLYKKHKEIPNSMDNVEVVAKIISTSDNNLKKSIIYAANNQNAIDKDLQSLNEFHEKVETYFLGKEEANYHLCFERLRGQYAQITPPYSKVNIETLARIYISVFIQKPHEMKSNALSRIEELQNNKTIFNNPDNIADYYYCTVLWYWFNHFLVNNTIRLKSKTMDMHVLLACNLLLSKEKQTTDEKISYLSEENNAKSLFESATNILNNKGYLFERRGFYSAPKTNKLIQEITNATN
jgi:hypothetical protein